MRGFTLLELLIVLVIISLLVSMAAINTNRDPRIDRLNEAGEELKFLFEVVSDEAIFKDKTLGVEFSKDQILFYERRFLPEESDPSQLKPAWVKYEGSVRNPYSIDEDFDVTVKVDGQLTVIPFEIDVKKPSPKAIFQATGEQSLILLEISIEDVDLVITVRGNGTGRFYKESEQYES